MACRERREDEKVICPSRGIIVLLTGANPMRPCTPGKAVRVRRIKSSNPRTGRVPSKISNDRTSAGPIPERAKRIRTIFCLASPYGPMLRSPFTYGQLLTATNFSIVRPCPTATHRLITETSSAVPAIT